MILDIYIYMNNMNIVILDKFSNLILWKIKPRMHKFYSTSFFYFSTWNHFVSVSIRYTVGPYISRRDDKSIQRNKCALC